MAKGKKLTVIGESHAKEGLTFTYRGETDAECAKCRLHKVCHDLTPHRTYAITNVRTVKHDVCHVFEGKVQVVEVEERPLRMAIPVASLRGTAVTKHFDECGAACLLKRHCNPAAIPEGGKAVIREVGEDVPCLVGRKLKFAVVEPER